MAAGVLALTACHPASAAKHATPSHSAAAPTHSKSPHEQAQSDIQNAALADADSIIRDLKIASRRHIIALEHDDADDKHVLRLELLSVFVRSPSDIQEYDSTYDFTTSPAFDITKPVQAATAAQHLSKGDLRDIDVKEFINGSDNATWDITVAAPQPSTGFPAAIAQNDIWVINEIVDTDPDKTQTYSSSTPTEYFKNKNESQTADHMLTDLTNMLNAANRGFYEPSSAIPALAP